jgi:hypothetical protein
VPILKIHGEISNAIGKILRGERELVNAVINFLRDQLENHYDLYRMRRDPEDPALFDFYIRAIDSEYTLHTMRFSVDDSLASGYLFIAAVSDRHGPFPT